MKASARGIFRGFTLQLNAAILALSINANTVAFGDEQVNMPARLSAALASAGTMPITINGAMPKDEGFSPPGAAFPVTLSPGQTATLNVQFDTVVVGSAIGQLSIASNPSTNGREAIGLSATGKAALAVAVAVTPATASVTTGAAQQFSASVTGTSNTAVTWTVSGPGCSGKDCGTISSSGLYTAPATVPSSALITITANSILDQTQSASTTITIVPPQAAEYMLVWQDNFGTLDVCKTNSHCNWYTPGTAIWGEQNPSSGVITDPSGTYLNLNWVANQKPIQVTSMSTVSADGAYYEAWKYGYFEVNMAFTASTGSWPAIWMVPLSSINDNGYQNGGEIDIIEWQSKIPTTFNGTLHTWNNGTETGSEGITPTPVGINYNHFNTYGLLWTPTQICWYLNNVQMGCESTTSAPWNAAFNGFGPYALIIDQAAGCNWINSAVATCTGQVSPLNLQLRWVHVYASLAVRNQ
jgi:glycosyl hydrolase family 16